MIFNMNTAALFAFLLASQVSTGSAHGCFWDVISCKHTQPTGLCCSETWHRLEEKEPEHTRFLKGSRALDEESAVPTNEFSSIPGYLQDRLSEGVIDQDEYNYMTAFYNGLKICREYERGIAVTPAADDGNRALNDKCFFDLFCTSGNGYCCSETWHLLEDGSKDRYLALPTGQNETFAYTQTNTFYGIPKHLRDQLKAGEISQDEYILLEAYYDGLKTCREYERSNN